MPRKRNWTFTACPTRHLWEGDTAVLVLRKKYSGRTIYSGRGLNFSKLAIRRGGLLEASILEAPCPLHTSNVNSFVAAIEELAQTPRVRSILGASSDALSVADIHFLFKAIDDYFAKKGIKTAAPQADVVRKIIIDSGYRLVDGTLIKRTGFTTKLRLPPRQAHPSLSSKPDPRFVDPFLALPVSATGSGNPKEQDAQFERHYRVRLEAICEGCVAALNDHDRLVHRIREARNQGLPDSLQQRTKNLLLNEGRCDWKSSATRDANDRLRMATFLVTYHDLYKHAPTKHFPPLNGIPELIALVPQTSARYLFTALLSDYYLSRTTIVACYVILLIETGWNNDTLLSLTIDRIQETHRGFELTGVKGKTDQLQTCEVPVSAKALSSDASLYLESAAAVRAIRLLIEHNANVDKYSVRRHSSIFVSLNARYSGRLEFDLILRDRDLKAFCQIRGLPAFQVNELRNQVAQYKYIKSGRDLSVPQATLGHASSRTTEEYVNSSIEYLSNEANIKRFMDLLGASVLFVSGRLSISKKDQSPEAILARTLLWPPSRYTDESHKCRIDQWLESGKTLQLKIGIDEAQHCAYQKKYYTENLSALINANPERFRTYELPRILICYALYKLIDASPLKRELRICEAALYV